MDCNIRQDPKTKSDDSILDLSLSSAVFYVTCQKLYIHLYFLLDYYWFMCKDGVYAVHRFMCYIMES